MDVYKAKEREDMGLIKGDLENRKQQLFGLLLFWLVAPRVCGGGYEVKFTYLDLQMYFIFPSCDYMAGPQKHVSQPLD